MFADYNEEPGQWKFPIVTSEPTKEDRIRSKWMDD